MSLTIDYHALPFLPNILWPIFPRKPFPRHKEKYMEIRHMEIHPCMCMSMNYLTLKGNQATRSKQMKILEGNLCHGNSQEKQMMCC